MSYIQTPTATPSVTITSTDQRFPLGASLAGANGGEYVYVKAAAALAVGSAVSINSAADAALLTKTLADGGNQIGFAQVAFASGEYGFVKTKGRSHFVVKAKNGCQPNVALYTSASPGFLDDSSTSQTRIYGIRLVDTATSSGAAESAYSGSGVFQQVI